MFYFVDDDVLMKVASLFGEEAVTLVSVLRDVDEITEDEIASRTEIRLNDVRKILYKLYSHSLVALRRTRSKDTGWFVFRWKLQPDQLEGFIVNKKRRVLEKLENRLEYEKKHEFYHCNNPECTLIPFEEAIELLFKCPTCGKPLVHYDNSKIVEALTRKVELLRKETSE